MDPLILQKLQQALNALIRDRVLLLDADNSGSQVELSFVAPNAEFVVDLGNRPIINCYLIGVNEDKSRRHSEPMRSHLDDTQTLRTMVKEPKFVELHYMLTVWCKDKLGSAQIEHMLLGYLITGLGAFDFVPQDLLARAALEPHLYGVRLTLFGSESSDRVSGQVWQALGSTPKPSLMLSISLPVPVHAPVELPVVREIERALKRTN